LGQLVRSRLIATYVYVPLPVDESISRIQSLHAGDHGLLAEAWERGVVGRLYAMMGEFDRGRELVRGARQAYLDAGLFQTAGGIAMGEAHLEGIASLEAIGERAFYPTAALQLATLLYAKGRFDEVREWCEKARGTTGADDITNFLDLELLEGLLLARDNRLEEAEAAAQRAIQRLEGIDMNEIEAYAHGHLSEIFALTNKPVEAREHGSRSLSIAARKGDVALGARLREWLTAVGVEVA
jgi:tetratricopeptide (TPR) repeat protein